MSSFVQTRNSHGLLVGRCQSISCAKKQSANSGVAPSGTALEGGPYPVRQLVCRDDRLADEVAVGDGTREQVVPYANLIFYCIEFDTQRIFIAAHVTKTW